MHRIKIWIVALMLASSIAFSSSDSPLVEAVKAGDKAAVQALLAGRADVNAVSTDGATALAWAAHFADLDMVRLLIRGGANVETSNEYGATPLWLACDKGDVAIVEELLKAGANPNAALASGETPLMTASGGGSSEVVQTLLAHGAKVNAQEPIRGQTALMWAAAEKQTGIVDMLLAHGADIHARSEGGFTPLLFASQQGDVDSARILLTAGAQINAATPGGMSPLLLSIIGGHESLAVFLVEQGASPDTTDNNGFSVLNYAASGSDGTRRSGTALESAPLQMPELVKALLAHGAEPNTRLVKNPPTQQGDAALNMVGATPLLLAAAAGNVDVVRVLAANGADTLIATNDHTTPLMVAAGVGQFEDRRQEEEEVWNRNHLETARLLVELGADVNAAGEYGWTALHGAAYTGSNAIIELLVERGARMDVMDKFGQTPLSIAEGVITAGLGDDAAKRPRNIRKSTADLLLKLGATPLAESGVEIVGRR